MKVVEMNKVQILFAFAAVVLLTACGRTSTSPDKDSPGQEGHNTPNTVEQILAKPEIPILCYHRISESGKGDYTISPKSFKAHMKVLSDSGFHSISPVQLYDWLVYDRPLPENPVMITFDDSRLEHGAIAAPTLEKYGFRGVFFIMTITYGKKNYMTTEQIAALAKAGHTIGLHTWDHTMVTKFKDSTDWRKEIIDPQAKLAGIIGEPVDYFAYPNGVFNQEAAKKLSSCFKLSFSLISKRDSTYPLQNVRRMITTDCKPESMLKIMQRTFRMKNN
jgi:peptidoglycan/xylan/chitin deacetylase (PgdA/CDA1 family)